MSSSRVLADKSRLNVFDYDIEELRRVADAGGVLYWNNDGLEGKVPNAVLRDVLEAVDDWQRLEERHPDALFPPVLGTIWWEQTMTVKDPSAPGRCQPLPLRSQGQSQSPSRSGD